MILAEILLYFSTAYTSQLKIIIIYFSILFSIV